MRNYGEYREATRAGIRKAGCDAVLAEDFAAQGTSARNACIDGVRSADALVLLLGPKYGWVAPSGRSATEEEYQAAREQHLPILVFVQDGVSREPKQQQFIERVEDYTRGHFRKSFKNSSHLKTLVMEAIMDRDWGDAPGDSSEGERRIRQALDRRPPYAASTVWMKTVWATPRTEEVVDPLTLDDDSFQRQFLRLGHDSEPPMFEYDRSRQREATASQLLVTQGVLQGAMADEHATEVAIQADGTLTSLQNATDIRPTGDHNLNFVRMYRLDPNVVRDRLERAWSFAAAWWNSYDEYLRHEPLLYNVAFYDIGGRAFQDPEKHPPGRRLEIPPACPHNPLIVFEPSRPVSRSHLNTPGAEVSRIVTMVKIRFREWANNIL